MPTEIDKQGREVEIETGRRGMKHSEPHTLARKEVKLKAHPETTVTVEDYWDRVYGKSWMDSDGNLACMNYAIRSGRDGLPLDDEVLYAKDPYGVGHLIHCTEIEPVALQTKMA